MHTSSICEIEFVSRSRQVNSKTSIAWYLNLLPDGQITNICRHLLSNKVWTVDMRSNIGKDVLKDELFICCCRRSPHGLGGCRNKRYSLKFIVNSNLVTAPLLLLLISQLAKLFITVYMGLLPDTYNCGLLVHWECLERFPHPTRCVLSAWKIYAFGYYKSFQ